MSNNIYFTMERIQQNQRAQEDLSDPNLFLAAAMVKSIYSLLDSNQGSSEEAEEQKIESLVQNAGKNAPDKISMPFISETIELTPVQDLQAKINSKKLLSKEELIVLAMAINAKFQNVKDASPLQINHILVLGFTAALNTYSYSLSQNFLEKSALHKLSLEILLLVSRVLDELMTRDPFHQLANQALIPIIMALEIFLSKEGFANKKSQYTRSSARIQVASLGNLNQYLVEHAPEIYGGKKQSVQRRDEQQANVVVLPQYSISDDESLDKALEIIPEDYKSMTAMLSKHLKSKLMISVKDEDVSHTDDEEEKSSAHGSGDKDLCEACREEVSKLKILDKLTQVIERLVNECNKSSAIYAQIQYQIFKTILKNYDFLGLNSQVFAKFIVDDSFNKALQGIDFISKEVLKEGSKMEIDSEDQLLSTKGLSSLPENVLLLAKSCEVQQYLSQLENNSLNVKQQLSTNMNVIIDKLRNFKVIASLMKLKKTQIQALKPAILSICLSILRKLVKDNNENLEQKMIILSKMLQVLSIFHSQPLQSTKQDEPKKDDRKQSAEKPKEAPSSATRRQTRQQLKKEIEDKKVKKEGSPDREDKKRPDSVDFTLLIADAFDYDTYEILKHCMGLLLMLMPQYLSSLQGEINSEVFKNIFDLGSFTSDLTGRFVYGIQSELTRPEMKYSDKAIEMMKNHIKKAFKKNQNQESNKFTVFVLKLMILLKDKDMPSFILQQILEAKWKTNKGNIKNQTEIYEGQNLRKYLLFVSSILLNSNDNTRNQWVGYCLSNIKKDESPVLYLHLLEILSLKTKFLMKFKHVVFDFMAKLLPDNDEEAQFQPFVQEIEKQWTDIQAQKEAIYEIKILTPRKDDLSLSSLVSFLQKTLTGKNLENKATVLPVLKQVVRLSQEVNQASGQCMDITSLIQQYKSNCNDLFVNSLIDRTFQEKNQTVLYLLREGLTLIHEDLDFIQQELEMLKILTTNYNEMQQFILKNFFDFGNSTHQNSIPPVITNFIQLSSSGIKIKLQEFIVFKSTEENKLASIIIDPPSLQKALSDLMSKDPEENLYSHLMAHSGLQAQYQVLISTALLVNSFYRNCSEIVASFKDQHESLQREIAMNLLKVKRECPFLDYNKDSLTIDNSFIDSLLLKLKINQQSLSNKDYSRCRVVDQVLVCLDKSINIMNDIASVASNIDQISNDDKDLRNFTTSLAKEAVGLLPGPSSLKTKEESDAFSEMLAMQGPHQDLYYSLMKNKAAPKLWEVAFKYLDQSQIESAFDDNDSQTLNVKEKKGGVQIVFNNKSSLRRGGGRKVGFKEAGDNQNQEVKEQKAEKKQQISVVSLKLFHFITELMQQGNNQRGQRILSIMTEAFLLIQTEESQRFILVLEQLGQTTLVRKIVHSLLQVDQNQALRNQVASILNNQLVLCLQQSHSEQQIISVIELAQLTSSTNLDLFHFISAHILTHPLLMQSMPTKMTVLDFVCQMGLTQFTKTERLGDEEVLVYSVQGIQERRKKAQADRVAQETRKREELKAQKVQEEKEEGNVTLSVGSQSKMAKEDQLKIEGLKQEKLLKEDKESTKKYMERPEEGCTFLQTKKDFRMQHWYFCYTCGFTGNSGVCAVCVHTCHKGHQIAYSRKSNFFCDCGDSGRCQSLKPSSSKKSDAPKDQDMKDLSKRPSTSKRKRIVENQENPQRNPKDYPPLFLGENPFIKKDIPANPFLPPRDFMHKYGFPSMDEEDEVHLFYRHLDGIMERERAGAPFDQPIKQPSLIDSDIRATARIAQIQDMIDSSDEDDDDEDLERDEAQFLEIQKDSISQEYKSIGKIMQMIKEKERVAKGQLSGNPFLMGWGKESNQKQKPDSPSSLSQISSINPLEDPLSETSSAPMYSQKFEIAGNDKIKITTSQLQDAEMEDTQTIESFREKIRQEDSQFEQVFAYLMDLMKSQISASQTSHMEEVDEIMSSFSSPSKRKELKGFRSQKQAQNITQDLTLSKKIMRENSFLLKFNEKSKQTCMTDINYLSVVDSNKDGLVAICEQDSEISFYASSQFFEDGLILSQALDNFNFESKDGVSKTDTFTQLGFNPLRLRFNPAYPNYLAVGGTQNLDVLTLSKQGKVLSKLSVNLLLEIYANNATLIGVEWLPGSQTCIAVGTRDFIKVYNLAEDYIAPTHNILIMNGFISTFSFGKQSVLDINGNRGQTTIYVGSKDGKVYYQEVSYQLGPRGQKSGKDVEMVQNENYDMMLTTTVNFSPLLGVQDQDACFALKYSELADLLLVSFQGGLTVAGQIDESQAFNGFKIAPIEDQGNKNQALLHYYSKHGEILVDFRDIVFVQGKEKHDIGKVCISAVSRKLNNLSSGVPCVIEIAEASVSVNVCKQSNGSHQSIYTYGMTYAKSSNKSNNASRLICINNDGSSHSFILKSLQDERQSLQQHSHESIHRLLSQQASIKKTDLPKEVKLSPNFFEKMKNIYSDANLRQKFQINGDITHYFSKNSKSAFEGLSKSLANQIVLQEQAKRSLKMMLKLELSSDHVFTGFRVKLDLTHKSSSGIQAKLFNRVVSLKAKAPIWFDIPFCDAEVIFGFTNGVEVELVTEDVQNCPIKIYAMEFFAMSRKDFQLREKLKKIEKQVMQKEGEPKLPPEHISQEIQIKNELLKTKGVPLVTWKEKLHAFESLDKHDAQLTLALDVITQYMRISPSHNINQLHAFIESLRQLLKSSLFESRSKESYLVSSLKRCLHQSLLLVSPSSSYGDPYNYETLKDQVVIDVIVDRLCESEQASLQLEEVRHYLQCLQKLSVKRYYQLLQVLDTNPHISLRLVTTYLRLFKNSDSNTQKDVQNIFTLILASYYHNVNQKYSPSENIAELFKQIYADSSLSKPLQLVSAFLLHQDEQMQIVSASTLVKQASSYQRTALKALTYNQLPVFFHAHEGQTTQSHLVINDFIPHMIDILLGMIAIQKSAADVAYSLAYKLLKLLETAATVQTAADFAETVAGIVVRFIRQVLLQSDPQSICESEGEQQFLYCNLAFVNLLMHSGQANGSEIKIKRQKLSFNQQIQEKVIRGIGQDGKELQTIMEWLVQMFDSYASAFRDGKCSLQMSYNEGIPLSVIEKHSNEQKGEYGVFLLRPIAETQPWKWHPIFIQTDQIFEMLDRKVPAQLLLFVLFGLSKVDTLSTDIATSLINSIREVAFKKPASQSFQSLGSEVVRQMLHQTFKNKYSEENELNKTVKRQLSEIKNHAYAAQFAETLEKFYLKFIKVKKNLTFDMQFHIHSFLSTQLSSIKSSPVNWSSFLSRQSGQQPTKTIDVLIECALVLNEESAMICLAIAALGFFQDEAIAQSLVTQIEKIVDDQIGDIFSYFAYSQNNEGYQCQSIQVSQDLVSRLIDTVLLGKNKKQLRVLSAFIVKGIYETNNPYLTSAMLEKLTSVKKYGVNSQEFLAVFSYIVNREKQQGNLNGHQLQSQVLKVKKEIQQSTELISGHPNLEVYSALQRISPSFQGSDDKKEEKAFVFGKHQKQDVMPSKSPKVVDNGGGQKGRKITNPYMLENEACSKCFEQRSLPYQACRLNELKQEAKYTDSSMIYRFNSTYQIKQITMNLHEIRGHKILKTLHFYINSKQGVDLADMRNNWAYWSKVKSVEVDPGQRNIVVDFALPINASNMLISFDTVNLSKPLTGKEKQAPSHKGPQESQSLQVIGIDTVLQTLPKEIVNRIGVQVASGAKGEGVVQGSVIDKELMNCPRCGKQIQGKHGICNTCGENALQCTFCRNINYEKPDGYLCNECGFSRFAKFDFYLTVKQGYACEKIENEDQKKIANSQIEINLQNAQTAFEAISKKAALIKVMVSAINEGNANEFNNSRVVQQIYGEEVADNYHKMMKSLNTIKILKSEIENFMQGVNSQSSDVSNLMRQSDQTHNSTVHQSGCFSCIQDYLRSLLNFVEQTADSLRENYNQEDFVSFLFSQNLNMHSSTLQKPARKAICNMVVRDQERSMMIIKSVEEVIYKKLQTVPPHLLAQNISAESQVVLQMIGDQLSLHDEGKDNFLLRVFQGFWALYFKTLQESETNAALANQVTRRFINKVRVILEDKQENDKKFSKKLLSLMVQVFDDKVDDDAQEFFSKESQNHLGKNNFLIQNLIIASSSAVREEALRIIQHLLEHQKELKSVVLTQCLGFINKVLQESSQASDQYFDLLTSLLKSSTDVEEEQKAQAFEILFEQIDRELNSLVHQEDQQQSMGQEGFMPQLQTGQLLSKLVALISVMVTESKSIKSLLQMKVDLIIKCFLKIRKLNLIKNKVISQSETELEKMFRELHSEKDQDKENFILECVKVIQSGGCDFQEMRFLFEEICKVIDPVKPDPEYLLNLHKAQTQEFFFRGKMSKNPYSSSQLGKTMADVRLKICKELELAEPELVELLVAGKIVGVDLTIKQVYEQVFWPALCKQRDPERYDTPSIEEAPKSELAPMNVTFRLMGIDGEATEDRVESLADGGEAEQSAQSIEKKYGITQVLTRNFKSKSNSQITNGVSVLLNVLESFGPLQRQRYLAEWLFKLMSYAIKIKSNRKQFVKNKQTTGLLAQRLFESVGMQSQIEGQKGVTLFDVVLGIFESIVIELNEEQNLEGTNSDMMEIDQKQENTEATTHVEIFFSIIGDACQEMANNLTPIEKTSKKIRAVSKILPFLISKEDHTAIQVIVDFIIASLENLTKLDQPQSVMPNKQRFEAQFNLERVIEILESIPVLKNFIKEQLINQGLSQKIRDIVEFLLRSSLSDLSNENLIMKYKLTNMYSLKIINALVKNHPYSQSLIHQCGLVQVLYQLTQAKYSDKQFIIQAQDIVESLTNKNHMNDQAVFDYLRGTIDQQNESKKRLAQKKKEEIMRQMQRKKDANKFLKQIENVSLQEETGPRCMVCQDGYTKKPAEVLGMYVFSKKLKISEISPTNIGFITTFGYTTVTHSNFIHFTCHQNAYRADASLKQPKKEWEGAIIRNDHTKCNNLIPLRGGSLSSDAYHNVVERYFTVLQKLVANCDSDKVKVVLHDLKMIVKRLASEDSFSRDSLGGGPEHNMRLIPFFIQMAGHLLKLQDQYLAHDSQFVYVHEKRLHDFLEQGIKQKHDFMQKLEEEKKHDEFEEEEKFSELSEHDDDDEGNEMDSVNNFKLDQIAFQLTQCLIFTQMPKWEQYKQSFLSVILCTIAGMKEDKGMIEAQMKPQAQQTEFASGKRVITISKQTDTDVSMQEDLSTIKRRRLSSDNKIELIQRSLFRLRPLLLMMRIVDLVKQRWDGKRLGLWGVEQSINHEVYLKRLNDELIGKGNLQEIILECDEVFREYKDRMIKIGSVEEFLQDLGILDSIVREHGNVEQYVLSHF